MMYSLIKVGFEYKNDYYDSLIRVKSKTAGMDYEITIMNGELEKLLYGNHIIRQRMDRLIIGIAESAEQAELKIAVAEALSKFVQVPVEEEIVKAVVTGTEDTSLCPA